MKKKCNNCNELKSRREFSKSGVKKDGLQANCRLCARLLMKIWYEENHAKAREQREQWKVDNPVLRAYHGRVERLTQCEKEELKVYFIQGESTGLIKIGQTALPIKHRLSGLQSASPDKLKILLVLPNANEKAIHKKFAAHRVHGEWFKPAPDLLEFIQNFGNIMPRSVV